MRPRSLAALLALAAGVGLYLRRTRRPAQYVEVYFDDRSMLRFTAEPEARDLLDDAREILAAAR